MVITQADTAPVRRDARDLRLVSKPSTANAATTKMTTVAPPARFIAGFSIGKAIDKVEGSCKSKMDRSKNRSSQCPFNK